MLVKIQNNGEEMRGILPQILFLYFGYEKWGKFLANWTVEKLLLHSRELH